MHFSRSASRILASLTRISLSSICRLSRIQRPRIKMKLMRRDRTLMILSRSDSERPLVSSTWCGVALQSALRTWSSIKREPLRFRISPFLAQFLKLTREEILLIRALWTKLDNRPWNSAYALSLWSSMMTFWIRWTGKLASIKAVKRLLVVSTNWIESRSMTYSRTKYHYSPLHRSPPSASPILLPSITSSKRS